MTVFHGNHRYLKARPILALAALGCAAAALVAVRARLHNRDFDY